MLDAENVAVGVMSARSASAMGVDDGENLVVSVVFEYGDALPSSSGSCVKMEVNVVVRCTY